MIDEVRIGIRSASCGTPPTWSLIVRHHQIVDPCEPCVLDRCDDSTGVTPLEAGITGIDEHRLREGETYSVACPPSTSMSLHVERLVDRLLCGGCRQEQRRSGRQDDSVLRISKPIGRCSPSRHGGSA